jgi:hypothetical protein
MSTTTSPQPAGDRAPFPSPQWWIRDREGRVVVAQPPNAAILVWLATVVLGRTGLVEGATASTVRDVGRGALLVWALDELLRGASPVRRIMGGVVLAAVVLRLLG